MKTIILLVFLIGLSLSYDTAVAIKYARSYCSHPNPKFSVNYASVGEEDSAHFVSECMQAGGIDFRTCSVSWIDSYGLLPRVRDLKSCLQQKGWKHSTSRPASFKAGYPIFSTQYEHAMIATGISGGSVRFCAHTPDRCDATISNNNIEYYYE